MREIILKSISAGPDGVMLPGRHSNVPKGKAASFVDAEYAEYTDNPPPIPSDPEPEETAVTGPAETAAKKAGRKK